MGYGYDMYHRLCCDGCGNSSTNGASVRKRKCPHMVLGDTLRSRTRHAMHYCYAPALCSDCYRSHGGKHLHDACAEGAAASQAKYDAIEAALDAGESFVIAAYGEWHESVPDGMVGLLFRGRSGEVNRLAKAVDYNRGGDTKLSDIETQPWEV